MRGNTNIKLGTHLSNSCRGKPNLPLRTRVCGTPRCGQQGRLASCTAHPNPPAVGPSKWAKAEHAARLLLSHIYIFDQAEGNAQNPQLYFGNAWQTTACRARFSASWINLAHRMLKCVPGLRFSVKCMVFQYTGEKRNLYASFERLSSCLHELMTILQYVKLLH